MLPTVLTKSADLLNLGVILGGEWADATMTLFTNDVNPGPSAVLTDFVAATFAGATPQPIVLWGEPFVTIDAQARALAELHQWDWDSGLPEVIYGIFFTTTPGGALLGYARFETPIAMEATNNSLAVVPGFNYGTKGAGAFITAAPPAP